jgi:D-alanyl-D-alanine carboxypeptidase
MLIKTSKKTAMKSTFLSILLVIITGVSSLSAQELNTRKLDSLFDLLAQKQKAMGSIAISRDGKILYTKAIGYSSITGTEQKPSTPLTRYRIGSISKMFTATMIFQLIEDKKLSLDATLGKWFPAVPNSDKITIANMLNHRSGIHSFTDNPDYTSWMTSPKTDKEMLDIIVSGKPEFQPDEKTAYSNSNFVLLGYILERITGSSYAENLKKRITGRIGLKNTFYGGKINIENNDCFSFEYDKNWKQLPETDMSIPGGAGALISTPSDLVTFIQALFTGRLVSAQSLEQMKTIKDGMGMGMFQFPFGEKKAYGHNGGIDGFGSNLAYFPEDKLAGAYCTNGMVMPVNDILIGVLSICFNKEYKLPTFKTFEVKPEDLDKYTGVYSSTQLPLKITITKTESGLKAQATGQSAFPLEAAAPDKFKFDRAGIKMEFDPANYKMTLFQGGGTFVFNKEN